MLIISFRGQLLPRVYFSPLIMDSLQSESYEISKKHHWSVLMMVPEQHQLQRSRNNTVMGISDRAWFCTPLPHWDTDHHSKNTHINTRILISLHLQITKSVPGMGRGRWGGFFKTNRQRHEFKVKRRREKIENKRFKRGKRGKGTSSNRDRNIFRGSPRRRRGGGVDKYTPLHWMTGILISHLPPGEIEGAEQGWSCHLNPSSPLILHHHPSLHLSACSSSTPAQGCHLNPASLIASIPPPNPLPLPPSLCPSTAITTALSPALNGMWPPLSPCGKSGVIMCAIIFIHNH